MPPGLLTPLAPLGPAQLADLEGAVDTEGVGVRDVVVALVIFAVALIVAYLVGRFVTARLARSESQSKAVAALVARVVRWTIIVVGVAWSLSFIGLDLGWTTITIVLIGAGLLFILKPQMESLATAVTLTARPAFGIGDEIEVQDHRGEVIDITSRSTIIRLKDGRRVHIPNRDMLGETVTVWTTEQARRTSVEFRVDEGADLDALEDRVLAGLGALDTVASDPPPSLRRNGLGDGAVDLEVCFWHPSSISDGNRARDDVTRALLATLADLGLSTSVGIVTVDLQGDSGASTPG